MKFNFTLIIVLLQNQINYINPCYRNSIFIFLTNAGSKAIIDKYLNLWNKGYSREEMEIKDFDSILQKSSFNEIGKT